MKIVGYRPALFLLFSFVQVASAAIEGRVTDSTGEPVRRAWIYSSEESNGTYTDGNGRFLLKDAGVPTTLVVFHKDFEHREFEVISATTRPVEISLSPREGLSEEITVTARAPRADFSPVGAAASRVDPRELKIPTSTLVDIVASVPGIEENGQRGHLQVYSIRGVSRHRVRTSIGGVRLAGERRAGVSASFFDPFLMGSVELTRGPSVIRHGSGALGGAVEILPRTFEGWDVSAGYDSQGNGNFLLGGWGKDGWSIGLTRRSAGNAKAANGNELNTHFTQYTGLFSKSWDMGDREFRMFVVPALGDDIGKSNSDFPERTTSYPRERHLLVGFSTLSSNLWRIEAFFHPHDLQTRVIDQSDLSNVLTDSIDFGAKTTKQVILGSRYILNLGADYFARRSVDSEEIGLDAVQRYLDHGQEDEFGLNASLSIQLRRAILEGGARFTWFNQQNLQQRGGSDTAVSGFAGVSVPLTSGVEISGSVGSGLRFPSLSERFFTGTTGRGTVIGNPALDSERSINTDIGVKLNSTRVFASGYFFYNRISDYIERVDLVDSFYTFSNLTQGTIRGIEWETALVATEGSSIYFRGHLLTGVDKQGLPLSDIPVHRFALGFQRQEHRVVSYGAEWQFRDRKDDPGNGEQRIPSAQLLSAFLRFSPIRNFGATVALTNLLNELYYPTADIKAAFAPGRGIAISLSWMPGN